VVKIISIYQRLQGCHLYEWRAFQACVWHLLARQSSDRLCLLWLGGTQPLDGSDQCGGSDPVPADHFEDSKSNKSTSQASATPASLLQWKQGNRTYQPSPMLCTPITPFSADRPHCLRSEFSGSLFALAWHIELACGPMPNVMAALPNIGGALCSTPQSLADTHYYSAA